MRIGIDEADLHVVDRRPHGTRLEPVRQIARHDRRAFRNPVALHDERMGSHLFGPLEHRLRAFLRAGDNHPQRSQVLGQCRTEQIAEERWRSDHDRRLVGGHGANQSGGVGGVGIMGHANAREHRGQDVGQQPETMERRKEAQQDVAARSLQARQRSPQVRKQVAVRERHRLGCALGTRGKENYCRGIDLRLRQAMHHSAGQHVRGKQTHHCFQLADARADVFQVQVLGALDLDAEPVDQLLRGNDVADAQRLDRMGQVGRAGRPIQQHG